MEVCHEDGKGEFEANFTRCTFNGNVLISVSQLARRAVSRRGLFRMYFRLQGSAITGVTTPFTYMGLNSIGELEWIISPFWQGVVSFPFLCLSRRWRWFWRICLLRVSLRQSIISSLAKRQVLLWSYTVSRQLSEPPKWHVIWKILAVQTSRLWLWTAINNYYTIGSMLHHISRRSRLTLILPPP